MSVRIEEERAKEIIRSALAASELIDAIRKMDARKQYAEAGKGVPEVAFKLQDLHIELDSLKAELRDFAEDADLDFPEDDE